MGDEFEGHTRGPWCLGPDRADGDHALMDADGNNVAFANHAGVDLKVPKVADARLIVAAPRLLRERDEARAQLASWLVTWEAEQERMNLLRSRAQRFAGLWHNLAANLRAQLDSWRRTAERLEGEKNDLRTQLAAARERLREMVDTHRDCGCHVCQAARAALADGRKDGT